MDLPFVDEHCIEVAAGPDATWSATAELLATMFSGRSRELFARTVGCHEIAPSGPRPLQSGSTITGFRVAEATVPSRLFLEGSHRFSNYALNFLIEELSENHSRVCAETRAEFPGITGSIYKALVIGTRAHVVIVRGALRTIKRKVET